MVLHDLMEYSARPGTSRPPREPTRCPRSPRRHLGAQRLDASGARVKVTTAVRTPSASPAARSRSTPPPGTRTPTPRSSHAPTRHRSGPASPTPPPACSNSPSRSAERPARSPPWPGASSAFWRTDFDHTTAFAYHTLHEVMDIAQNFGVPYDITKPTAGQPDVMLATLRTNLDQLHTSLQTSGTQLTARIQGMQLLQNDTTRMWTDAEDRALSTAADIVAELAQVAQAVAALRARVASNPPAATSPSSSRTSKRAWTKPRPTQGPRRPIRRRMPDQPMTQAEYQP
ncbi:hypothetical protein GXW82_00425 [Streptacidiphilus sp. 4-A2]|nr:hypothetical protein [Streptacidiphilus sp. 4-A2]